MENTQTLLKKLQERENKTFVLLSGDQVRLENQIFTVTKDGSFKATTENHEKDIPFYGELYKEGIRTWKARRLLKENDCLATENGIYKVINTDQKDDSMHHALIKTN